MKIADGKENGLYWSLTGMGRFINIRVEKENDKETFVEEFYECQYDPISGYDTSDVALVNNKLDDMIKNFQ